ncbi:MAG: hypothetical protein S4CHLAM81_07990 [Chlamydiales bacterium]|nr:hypothetical protein [Chlamydiales bacterium]MCH9635581.1 hypothetical protein [Chlamydiales bacterium]MCH9704197.1 DegQ family serine endoprotease [Chlamydiota bacterium]
MRKIVFVLVLFCSSVFANEGLLREISKGFSEVASSAVPAVVFIESQMQPTASREPARNPFDYFGEEFFNDFFGFPFQSERRQTPQSRGSGFLVSSDGLIMTNNHVVEKSQKIMVTLNDGRKMSAEVIGTDPQTDLALIKVDGKDFPYLKFGNSNDLNVGDWTIAIGNPFGLQASLTVGVVSAKGRGQLHITDFENFIQTDAAINPGNSGGPLLNVDGEVIGINTAIASAGSGGYIGIGFAIPSMMAVQIQEHLVKDGSVTRGYLGATLQPIDSDLAKFYGLDRPRGALVVQVAEDSPAAKAGLKQEDIILAYNGKEVDAIHTFRNSISLMAPGTRVKLEVLRDGKKKQITVTVGDAPSNKMAKGSPIQKLGLHVQNMSAEMEKRTGEKGVMITQVAAGSPAALANLTPGSIILAVNRKNVTSIEEFTDQVSKASKEGRVLLMVKQSDVTRFVALHFD